MEMEFRDESGAQASPAEVRIENLNIYVASAAADTGPRATTGVYSVEQAGPLAASMDYEQLAQAVAKAIGSVKIYVSESEITTAQNSYKAIVEKASF